MTVEIVEVMRRATQGMTRPFICRGDDDHTYFVKGSDAGRHSLFCEWLAGGLAQSFGLPIAPFDVVEVPRELLELKIGMNLAELGAGPCFGSREQQVAELSFSGIDQVPQDLQQDVLMFDWWVKNMDRSLGEDGGNPNLFWEPASKKLVVIDHNQAFDFSSDRAPFFDTHVFRAQLSMLANDWDRRAEFTARFRSALSDWPRMVAGLPQAWLFLDDDLTNPVGFDAESVYESLKDYATDEFWNWK